MKVEQKSGITIKNGTKKIILDPSRQVKNGVVTHGHLDHLVKDSYMTPPTLDILEVRKGEKRGKEIDYAVTKDIENFDVTLYPAGHVFGSAMIKVDDILYTGDFNPLGGNTCKRAVPYDCDTLIIESTYGKREYSLPSKEKVTEDLIAWTEQQLEEGPVVFGAYQFGKAQEIISLLNDIDECPKTTKEIAEISEVYNLYDQGLEFSTGDLPSDNYTAVVSPNHLKRPAGKIVRDAKKKGGTSAYLSGWCAFFPFYNSMEIDAQFPFSDHAGFDELLEFVEDCSPERVFTVHGSTEELAEAIEKKLDIEASPL